MFKRWMLLLALLAGAESFKQPHAPRGDVDAVVALAERVLPGSSSHFMLSITDGDCAGIKAPCFSISDSGNKTTIMGSGANELSAGVGYYWREHCNMTIGWTRGGGSNVFTPKEWPKVGAVVSRKRAVPWSYFMNVCTQSYSLVWYGWKEWEHMIDWMALSGINNVLATTGQEEVQYKVFKKLGLTDLEIRSWFNGPALLAWSRGQNEYGANIGGPLPRSWMKDQWNLNKQILARYRTLGIVGQLPGFQGNAPVGLKAKLQDSNMTDNHKGTAWMDSLDPKFGMVADLWMKQMIEDFGTGTVMLFIS
jgi:alpha-N-acetylglucosaminidase